MLTILKRLFRRDDPPLPTYDVEKAVGAYLLKLPRCSSLIIAVSPKYGDQHHRGELILDVVALLPWAEHHAESVLSSDKEEQAAIRALPLWLRGAALDDSHITYVPHSFAQILRPYAEDFIVKHIGMMACPDCRRVVKNVTMKKLNEHSAGAVLHSWTDEWLCPEGHLLYRQDQQIHMVFNT